MTRVCLSVSLALSLFAAACDYGEPDELAGEEPDGDPAAQIESLRPSMASGSPPPFSQAVIRSGAALYELDSHSLRFVTNLAGGQVGVWGVDENWVQTSPWGQFVRRSDVTSWPGGDPQVLDDPSRSDDDPQPLWQGTTLAPTNIHRLDAGGSLVAVAGAPAYARVGAYGVSYENAGGWRGWVSTSPWIQLIRVTDLAVDEWNFPWERGDRGAAILQRVLILEVDPMLPSGQTARQRTGAPGVLDEYEKARRFFRRTSRNRFDTQILGHWVWREFPVKEDGFRYTAASWLDVIEGRAEPHRPDWADLPALFRAFDVCNQIRNLGANEILMFGFPWAGFPESGMIVGPGVSGFPYNGPTVSLPECPSKRIPFGILGPHTTGHRAEATFTRLYGGWDGGGQSHAWERFASSRVHNAAAPSFGCGSVHFAANALAIADDYDFDLGYSVSSYCDEFLRYPNMRSPAISSRTITCEAWGCNVNGYEEYWWRHLPGWAGVGPDGRLNDWWRYVFDPNLVP